MFYGLPTSFSLRAARPGADPCQQYGPAYPGNSPLMRADPKGLAPFSEEPMGPIPPRGPVQQCYGPGRGGGSGYERCPLMQQGVKLGICLYVVRVEVFAALGSLSRRLWGGAAGCRSRRKLV